MIAFPVEDSVVASREALERLGEEIAALAAHLHSATYRLLVRLREFDEREGWGGGFPSCAHWLSWRTGIALGAAREKVRAARALAELPRLSAAMERGELSFSKVRALTRIATPAIEEQLLEVARQATAAQVERIVRAWRRVDRAEEAQAECQRHEARHLTVHVDEDGSYVVRGRLDPEVGALLEQALEVAAMALYNERRSTDEHREDTPTAPQRRADALGLLLDLALSSRELPAEVVCAHSSGGVSSASEPLPHDSGGVAVEEASRRAVRSLGRAGRVQIVVHVDAGTLRDGSDSGQSVLAGGSRVSAETSRRLACDASRVVMTHDSVGDVLDVGRRTRVVPAAIRRALEHRDRGCRFPGCCNRFADAHHVEHWADGGGTRLENLVLLCRSHHRLVHEEGWRVIRRDSAEFTFTRPDGCPVENAPLMTEGSCRCPTADGGAAAGAATPPPFERLDLDWTLLTLYRPSVDLPRAPTGR